MRVMQCLAAVGALLLPLTSAQSNSTGPDENGFYWIYSEGLSAAFIPYGASIAKLLIKDQYGITRDVVGGFDNASYYSIDKQHPHFGGVPGRYANRIKNGTFTIDGTTYHTTLNENGGLDTLHGGTDGWDWRNFTLVSHTNDSITWSIVDPDGDQGFPGEVVAYITYTLDGWDWDFRMVALSTTKKTPIMLSSHTYWNLDGFANNETNLVFNHSLYMPYGGQRVGVDNILIPTGDIPANQPGSVNDFWSAPKLIGANFSSPDLKGNCGFNCTGYDTCYITNRDQNGPFDWKVDGFVARLQSAWSGIQVEVYTDQPAFQFYSCNGQNGSMALKSDQGLFNNSNFPRTIPQYGCLVMEVEDWIDAINQPEWGRDGREIYGPGDDPYVLEASYRFSINTTAT